MAANDMKNLESWLGWVEEKAAKGHWYPKGESAALDIAERLSGEELARTRERLEGLRTLCTDTMGEEGRARASGRIGKDILKARGMMAASDHAGAQKLILSSRERAARRLLLDTFEEELKELYRENTAAAFAHPLARSLMDTAARCYSAGWILGDGERAVVRESLDALMDDEVFTPVSELAGIAYHLETALEWAHWVGSDPEQG